MKVSSRRCITSVGTRIEGSTSRTSNSPIRSKMRLIVAGLAARRSRRPAHSMKLRVVHQARRHAAGHPALAPVVDELVHARLALLGAPGPLVAGRPGGAREGRVEDQRARRGPDGWRRTAPPSGRPRACPRSRRARCRRRPSPRSRRPSAPRASGRPTSGSDRPEPRRSKRDHARERASGGPSRAASDVLGPQVLDLRDPGRDPDEVERAVALRRCTRC